MNAPADLPLKRTSLHATHVALGARMVPFGGWDMPVEYAGITAEHTAVRTAAGLFDVSHMGQIELAGPNALAAVQHLTSNDASKLQVGQAHYSALTTPEGTFVDDVLVYRMGPSHFLLVVNASNIAKDHAWIVANATAAGEVAVVNSSDRYALVAVQGPKAKAIVQALTAVPLDAIKYYWFAHGEVAGIRGTVSRTGYTGEDGFEIFVPAAVRAGAVGRAAAGRSGARAGAVRPRRPRHAAPRSGDAPLRQRHGRDHHGARMRPGVDRRLEQAGLPRPRGAAPPEGRRHRPGRSSASRWWSRGPSPATATPSVTTAPRSAR